MPTVDDMIGIITKRGGIARGNRYKVHITHPLKMTSGQPMIPGNVSGSPFQGLIPKKESSKNNEERFKEFVTDGYDTYLLCSAVTLPGKRITTTEATHNHHLAKKPYSMMTDEVSMSFLLTQDYYMKKYFDIWQEMIIDSSGAHYKTMYKDEYSADIEIQALYGNDTDQIGYGMKLERAYPIQVAAIELGNDQEGLMQLTVTWEYDNFKMTDIEEGMEEIRNQPAISKHLKHSNPKERDLNTDPAVKRQLKGKKIIPPASTSPAGSGIIPAIPKTAKVWKGPNTGPPGR